MVVIKESTHADIKDIQRLWADEDVMKYIKQESANIQSVINQFELFYESIELSKDKSSVILTTKDHAKFYVNLEHYIKNDIENYCSTFFD